jgi:hypothetical protein
VLPPRSGDATSYLDAANDDLTGARSALRRDVGDAGAEGEVPKEGDLLVASTADDGWQLRVDGVVAARSTTYGWANQFDATRTGDATLTYRTPFSRRAATAGQLLLWVVVVVVWRRIRRRERRAPAPAPSPVTGGEA